MFLDLWAVMRRQDPGAPKPEEIADHDDEPPWFPWVWKWFCDLRRPVTWSEIESWAHMTGRKPTSWECQLLIDLDRLGI